MRHANPTARQAKQRIKEAHACSSILRHQLLKRKTLAQPRNHRTLNGGRASERLSPHEGLSTHSLAHIHTHRDGCSRGYLACRFACRVTLAHPFSISCVPDLLLLLMCPSS